VPQFVALGAKQSDDSAALPPVKRVEIGRSTPEGCDRDGLGVLSEWGADGFVDELRSTASEKLHFAKDQVPSQKWK